VADAELGQHEIRSPYHRFTASHPAEQPSAAPLELGPCDPAEGSFEPCSILGQSCSPRLIRRCPSALCCEALDVGLDGKDLRVPLLLSSPAALAVPRGRIRWVLGRGQLQRGAANKGLRLGYMACVLGVAGQTTPQAGDEIPASVMVWSPNRRADRSLGVEPRPTPPGTKRAVAADPRHDPRIATGCQVLARVPSVLPRLAEPLRHRGETHATSPDVGSCQRLSLVHQPWTLASSDPSGALARALRHGVAPTCPSRRNGAPLRAA